MAQTETLIVVEDAEENRALICSYLEREGYRVLEAADGAQYRALLVDVRPDLVLLDLGLPDTDGLKLAVETRERLDAGIIFVSHRNSSFDRVAALELGGDDYIAKPVDLRELLARVRSVLRRRNQKPVGTASLRFAGFEIDLIRRDVRGPEGVPMPVTSGEMGLLAVLMEARGAPVRRDDLLAVISNRDIEEVSERTVDTLVRRLRQKIEAVGAPRDLIESVYGVGYRLAIPAENKF